LVIIDLGVSRNDVRMGSISFFLMLVAELLEICHDLKSYCQRFLPHLEKTLPLPLPGNGTGTVPVNPAQQLAELEQQCLESLYGICGNLSFDSFSSLPGTLFSVL